MVEVDNNEEFQVEMLTITAMSNYYSNAPLSHCSFIGGLEIDKVLLNSRILNF